jgi:hypothetical protein
MRSAGPDATVEALFPAHVDGEPPGPRAPATVVPVAEAVARWAKR